MSNIAGWENYPIDILPMKLKLKRVIAILEESGQEVSECLYQLYTKTGT